MTSPEASRAARPPSAVTSMLIVIAMLLLLIVVIVGLPMAPAAFWPRWAMWLGSLVLLGLLLWYYTTKRYVRPMLTSHTPTQIWNLPDDQVNVLRRSAGLAELRGVINKGNQIGDIQAKAFAFAVLRPEMVRMRITEHYEPGQRTLSRRVTIDVQIPSRVLSRAKPHSGGQAADVPSLEPVTSGVIFFPVLVPQKGELVNGLRVMAADGSLVPLLSYNKYLELVARVLRTLLCVAYQVEDLNETDHPEALEAETLALRGIMRRGRDGKDGSGYAAVNNLKGDGLRNPAARDLAANLVNRLTSDYALVAAVPMPLDGRFVITHERMTVPRLEAKSTKTALIGRIKLMLRLLLGARPVEIVVNLDDATTCQSYHLVIDGQDGVYVGEQVADELIRYFDAHATRLESERLAGRLIATPPPYYRFLKRVGQRYAHFYARFFPKPLAGLPGGDKVPSLRFRFYEVPPGSVFRAALASGASTLLIWIVGLVAERSTQLQTDAPAFLLVFPAIIASMLGFESRSHKLLEGTLASRLSLVVTAITSIAASAFFMFNRDTEPNGTMALGNPYGMQILGIDGLWWSLLVLISILNTACVCYTYLRRSWEFGHLSAETEG